MQDRRERHRSLNTKDYFRSSINDLVRETGLKKGGIYNHFGSKEQLALEAFDYAAEIMRGRFEPAFEGQEGALKRLCTVVDLLGGLADDLPVLGGVIIPT